MLNYSPFSSSNTKVDLYWSLLDASKNGGSPVLGYEIRFQKDGQAWDSVTVGEWITTYTINALVGGTTNLFTIAPFNKYGVGIHTAELSIIAGQEPDQVAAPSI
jgi:hypothetical protein